MTEILADYCASRPSVSDSVQRKVSDHILDWIGLVAGGRSFARSSGSLLDTISSLSNTGLPAGVPTGQTLAPDRAAVVAGMLAHSLDFDDTHRSSSLHPGAPVISAALPVAINEGSSGKEFIEAVSLGYDVTCGLGRAVDPDSHYAQGFHLTATCGTFGATAAIGHLRGFDAEEFEMAFGVNGSQVAGSLQFLANGAWNKRLHPGLAAQRGILAAELATNGFRGSAKPVTGEFGFFHGYTDNPHPELLESIEPGTAVLETGLKPYPCCRYMHAGIKGLIAIAELVDPASIESVEFDIPSPGVRLTGTPIERKRRPTNFVDCQFSAPFAAALALTTGKANLQAFLEAQERLTNSDLIDLMDRVTVTSTDRINDPFPAQWAAHVVVEADERYEQFVEHPPGEPEDPLDQTVLEAKFEELVIDSPLAGQQTDIIDCVNGLVEQPNLNELCSLLTADSN